MIGMPVQQGLQYLGQDFGRVDGDYITNSFTWGCNTQSLVSFLGPFEFRLQESAATASPGVSLSPHGTPTSCVDFLFGVRFELFVLCFCVCLQVCFLI